MNFLYNSYLETQTEFISVTKKPGVQFTCCTSAKVQTRLNVTGRTASNSVIPVRQSVRVSVSCMSAATVPAAVALKLNDVCAGSREGRERKRERERERLVLLPIAI